MTLSEASTLHSLAVWKEDCSYIKDFISKNPLPQIVRIVKGHYQGLGASSSLSSNSNSVVLLLNLGNQKRIHAQCVKFKDSRKVSALGPKIAIPSTFEGYFEILSEDGRCVRSMESVEELARRFPDSVLVRENIRAFVSKADETDRIRDKTRIVSAGETLLLIGEVNSNSSSSAAGGSNSLISSSSGSSASSTSPPNHHGSSRYLRCFDERGENVFLPYEARGKFSVIAKEDGISGVHSVSNILNKRLPLMARLASGPSPPVGLRHSQPFVSEMRLFSSVSEDVIMAFTLNGKESCNVVPLPQTVLLKVQAASNHDILKQTNEFSRLHLKAKELGGQLMNQLLVHDISLGRDLRLHGLDKQGGSKPSRQNLSPPLPSSRDNNANSIGSPTSKNTEDYDEIEQIYDYVRGFAPLPKGAKPWVFEDVPEPPPLETLPSRLNKPGSHHHTSMDYIGSNYAWMGSNQYLNDVKRHPHEKVLMPSKSEVKKRPSTKEMKPKTNENKVPSSDPSQRPRYIKSANHRQVGQKHKFFRSNKKDNTSGPLMSNHPSVTRPSPLFNLRYKSLTNLTGNNSHAIVAYSPDYDTLNSSNSGGKTSGGGDSGGSRNLPEKRSRKLCRPKSLTNLVWGNSPSLPNNNNTNNPSTPPHNGVKIVSDKSSNKHPNSGGLYAAHRRLSKELSTTSAIHGRKLGSSGNIGKRIGTLYL